MTAPWDLTALINAADPRAGLAERHLWLVRLMEWLRRDRPGGDAASASASASASAATAPADADDPARTPQPVLRLRHLLNQIDRHDPLRERVQGLVQAFWRDIDAAALFADLGFGTRLSFSGELLARLQTQLLPGTPETRDLAALFGLVFRHEDAAWLQVVDPATVARAAALLGPGPTPMQGVLLDAVTILVSAVQAAGYAPALRQRMEPALLQDEPFRQITPAAAALRLALLEGRTDDTLREAAFVRALLDACRRAADSVMPHLEAYGVSIDIVFELDQLQARTQRIEALVDALVAPDRVAEGQRLLLALVHTLRELRGVRALVARHYSLLARRVAERSAETGAHYIARTRAEYRTMLRRAAIGGSVIAGTVFGKFALTALGLTAFWAGLAAGLNYAASFLIVMLLHGTVATKQPAMTAPALAATLPSGRSSSDEEIEAFVDRVAQLMRSQFAGIAGNLALCAPLVIGVQWLATVLTGQPLVGPAAAAYVLDSLTLLGPTLLFAAFTGVLLFASSLIAGWAENWFVLHRLDSAIAWNPRIVATLGDARAKRTAAWWRANVSGVASSVSLGLMLGVVPAFAAFFGLPLDVRHVTLATGQLGAAAGALGWPLLAEPAFWWCVAGIAGIGALNLGVSFWLAFKVALRSRGVRVQDRARIGRAVRRRMGRQPLSFVLPPPDCVRKSDAGRR
ncbi:MAG: site-specific recombinase [Rubrivivax sp.]|nr:site-specific recombinase [Rubrivivax sp.]